MDPFPTVHRRKKPTSITFSDALHKITQDAITSVTYDGNGSIQMKSNRGHLSIAEIVPGSETALFSAVSRHVPHFQYVQTAKRSNWLPSLLPFVLLGLWWRILRSVLASNDHDFWYVKKKDIKNQSRKSLWYRFLGFLSRNNGLLPQQPLEEERSKTTFDDVISSAKHEVFEVVHFLNQPLDFQQFGASIPRGLLLVGPSGTGKTLIARAVADEAKVTFLSCAASDFIEIFVGKGAKRVRQIFEEARSKSPCVLFIDELDALGSRGSGRHDNSNLRISSGHEEYIQTLNQLLTEMDGFDRKRDNIVVIAATNRLSAVEPALLRAGRFDRWVFLALPTLQERSEILDVSIRKRGLRLNDSAKSCLTCIAQRAANLSGADLDCIVNEAAFRTHRRHRKLRELNPEDSKISTNHLTSREDFEEALNNFLQSRGQGTSSPMERGPRFVDLTSGLLSPSLHPTQISLPFLPMNSSELQ